MISVPGRISKGQQAISKWPERNSPQLLPFRTTLCSHRRPKTVRLMVSAGEGPGGPLPRQEAAKVLPRRFALATVAATLLGAAVRSSPADVDRLLTLNPTTLGSEQLKTVQAKDIGWFKKLGQSFNPSAIGMFGRVVKGGGILAMPHVTAPNIAHIAWSKLKDAGFKGCVFDKDNTLTEPYAELVAPQLASALEQCKRTFPDRVVLFSNSAGLQEFDPDGEEAAKVGKALGIPVLTHVDKKPGGEARELEAYFGCKAKDLVMVGDRYLTDIVFGNRLGMLTVRTEPLTLRGEPKAVLLARRFEDNCVHRWRKQGKTAPPHPLVSPALLGSFVLQDPTYSHPGLKTPSAEKR